jgi:hypothetical protein
LSEGILVQIDQRPNLKFLCDFIYDYHIISLTFIKFGYFIPNFLRLISFFTYLINVYTFTGIFNSNQSNEIDVFGFKYSNVR